jgi:spore germination protein YaaH
MRERKKQEEANKRGHRGIVILAIVLAVIVVGAGYEFLQVFGPNHTHINIKNYLGIQSDAQFALLVNTNMTGQYAYQEGETFYLPLQYISAMVDERLYMDEEQEAVLYALPEALVVARVGVAAYETGTEKQEMTVPCLVKKEDDYYISLDFLETVSDCSSEILEEYQILWLWNDFDDEFTVSHVKKDGEPLREMESIRGEIVTDLNADMQLYTSYQVGNFTYCIAENGLMGFVRTGELEETSTVTIQREKEPYVYTSIQMEEKVAMGWHQMDEYNYTDQVERLQELADTAQGLNVISPTWYSIEDEDGNLTSFASADYVKKAHELGLQVWALVDNFNSEVDNFALLSSYAARSRIIDRLITDAEQLGFDGINIDFEAASSGLGGMDSSCGTHFTEFLRELSIACRTAGVVLSVDNYVPASYNSYYDREEQGEIVDYVIVMGYDEHYAGSAQSGSVASYNFVKSGIENTLKEVPKEKVICAVPFYTRVWQVDEEGNVLGSEARSAKSMEQILSEQELTPVWRETEQQNFVEYTLDGAHYQVWLEDEASLFWKLELSEKYQLAGISCWKLGMEPESFWNMIREMIG